MEWVLLTLVYGLLKGVRDIVKKKSLQKSTVMEVLFFYTLLGFLFLLPSVREAAEVPVDRLGYIALKSFVIFLAWIASFKAIERIPVSVYGILDLSRVLFATLLGVVVLHEVLSLYQILGLILVGSGLIMLRFQKAKEPEEVGAVYVVMALASCILNAVSGLLDKLLTRPVTSVQLQFWYMLFLVLFYGLYILLSRTKVRWKEVLKNYWVWILAALFVIADRALFIANAIPESRITVMTLIKQSGCLVTILAGKWIFHEKNIGYKLFCAAVIIAGTVVGVC